MILSITLTIVAIGCLLVYGVSKTHKGEMDGYILSAFVGFFTMFAVVLISVYGDMVNEGVAKAVATEGGLTNLPLSLSEGVKIPSEDTDKAVYVVCSPTKVVSVAIVTNVNGQPTRQLFEVNGATCGAN